MTNHGSTVPGWTGSLTTTGSSGSFWGVDATGSGPYTLTPASYNDPIPAGGQISFGFNGTGAAVTPTLAINGQSVPFGATTPVANPDPTPTPAPTPGPVAGAPGTPSVSIQKNWDTGVGFTVNWAIYSGGQATGWTLLEDGNVYAAGTAAAGSSGGQTGAIPVLDRPYSAHVYQVQVTNDNGSALSTTTLFIADGASRISLGTPDAGMQARQVTIPLGAAATYPVSLVTGATGSYRVDTNNATVVSCAVAAGTLTVTGVKPGRASLRIQDTASGETRWLGVRVRNADGTNPGMPDYLALGSVSEDSTPDLTMWQQFGAGGLNRRVDARYIYLNGGPSNLYLACPGGTPFGYYSYLADPNYLYHFDLGYEHVFEANDGASGAYFYDFASRGFFYSSPTFPFPYLYDFSLNSVVYYYPDPANPGHYDTNGVRYFYVFNTGQIISK